MTDSELNLTISINHPGENLPLNAQEISGEVAKAVTRVLGLSEGRLYIMDDDRHATAGPVTVYLRSAFISNPGVRVASK